MAQALPPGVETETFIGLTQCCTCGAGRSHVTALSRLYFFFGGAWGGEGAAWRKNYKGFPESNSRERRTLGTDAEQRMGGPGWPGAVQRRAASLRRAAMGDSRTEGRAVKSVEDSHARGRRGGRRSTVPVNLSHKTLHRALLYADSCLSRFTLCRRVCLAMSAALGVRSSALRCAVLSVRSMKGGLDAVMVGSPSEMMLMESSSRSR